MKINRLPKGDGLKFTLDNTDFRCDWRGFLEAIKAFKDYAYDPETKEWWIGENSVLRFMSLKKQYFDNVLNKDQIEIKF